VSGPLAGLGVLVTRPAHQSGPLCAALAAAGATPLPFPALAIGPPPDDDAFAAALATIAGAHAAVFVSANAVAACAVHAVTLTSRACLDGLLAACPPGATPALRALPAAVLAPALAGHARAAGWTGPVLTAARAGDSALVEALVAWREQQAQRR
jgi:uroporphyrinogen-III synthase